MRESDRQLESVLREFGPMIARIAGNHEADPALREDLLQEISLAVWKALPGFRGEAGLRTFVARVAHNRAVDHLIHQSRRRERDAFDDENAVHNRPHKPERLHEKLDLAVAMRQLPLGYRQVMGLMLEGFRQAEIAEALGLAENTVAQRQNRARRQLKALLGEAQ